MEINKLLAAPKYDPAEIVDWYVKLARIADAYAVFEHPRISPVEHTDRNDYNVQVQAELSRLNADQLITLKHLALIASGGNTETISPGSNSPDRPAGQRMVRAGAANRGATPQRPVHALSGSAPPRPAAPKSNQRPP
jgi:hypothetical protein